MGIGEQLSAAHAERAKARPACGLMLAAEVGTSTAWRGAAGPGKAAGCYKRVKIGGTQNRGSQSSKQEALGHQPVYASVRPYMHVRECVCVCVCMDACVRMCAFVSVPVCACACV